MTFDGDTYAAEAEQRWGDTAAWTESRRRTATYTKDDWIEIRAADDANRAAFAALLGRGVPADAPEAVALAEQARRHIDERFYACSPAFHRCLADLYVGDERFRAGFDELAPGLAEYVHDAIHANAR